MLFIDGDNSWLYLVLRCSSQIIISPKRYKFRRAKLTNDSREHEYSVDYGSTTSVCGGDVS